MVQYFLIQYNGITFYDNTMIKDTVFLDASLQGLGGVFRNMVYSLPLQRGFRNYSIVHLEILNIVVALKIWGSFVVKIIGMLIFGMYSHVSQI